MKTDDSKLIDQAQSIAANLTYNEEPEASAKHIIKELCHRLGKRTVTITKKVDGYLMRDLFGESRFLTWKESMIYRLFGLLPEGKVLKTDAIDKAVKSALPAGYGRSVSPE